MLKILQQTLREHRLLDAARRVVLAVSGGADSVAMALALAPILRRKKIPFALAHLHHGIRGRAADEDMQFVRKLARNLKVSFYGARVDVPRLAAAQKISVEMAARMARYEFLSQVAKAYRAGIIATAHTADDQAETVLMQLLRGAGTAGLSGIPFLLVRGELRIIRPLRQVSRAQILAFLEREKAAWREDATNLDPHFLRNRIRHLLLPLLREQFQPNIQGLLCQTGEILAGDHAWLNHLARQAFAQCLQSSGNLDLNAWGLLPVAAQRRVLRLWLEGEGWPVMDFKRVEELRHMFLGRGHLMLNLSPSIKISKRGHVASLERAQELTPPYNLALPVPGHLRISQLGLCATSTWVRGAPVRPRVRVGQYPAELSVQLNRQQAAHLRLRSWRSGDRMRPLGLPGSKKLQDIFTDAHIAGARRARIPILECRGEIIWVAGYHIAAGWEVRDERRPHLHIRITAE